MCKHDAKNRGKRPFPRKSFRGKWAVIGSLPAEVKSRIMRRCCDSKHNGKGDEGRRSTKRRERVGGGKSGTFEVEKED